MREFTLRPYTVLDGHLPATDTVPPWHDAPYRLISWLEMQKFSAAALFAIGSVLQQIRHSLRVQGGDPSYALLGGTAVLSADEDRELDSWFETIKGFAEMIGLRLTQQRIGEIRLEMTQFRLQGGTASKRRMVQLIAELENLIRLEMESGLFLHVPADRADYYGKQDLFGQKARDAFPSASFDVTESGNCYAAGRYTACVFHLMRVLEIGLGALARQFGVDAAHKNWQNVIDQIQAKIAAISANPNKPATWKQDQEFYSQVASHFIVLKDAWRNYTAHARGKYTQEEANTIIVNVRAFMQMLATKLKE